MKWIICVVLLAFCHSVYASNGFDFGDVLALLLGMGISIVGVCACLGCYARRRNSGLDSL